MVGQWKKIQMFGLRQFKLEGKAGRGWGGANLPCDRRMKVRGVIGR